MSCISPIIMYRRPGVNPETGKFFPPRSYAAIAASHQSLALYEECAVPCGRCLACVKARARELLVRAVHEARLHRACSFVTLTVDDANIGDVFPSGALRHRPFQLFFKRLRKSAQVPLRYLMCAEYGERTLRPHYHAIIFGLDPDERRPLAVVKSDPLLGADRTLYTGFYDSQVIKRAWPYGNVYVGSCTPSSIAYCTGYTLKSFMLGRDDAWYKSHCLTPEYIKWSRRPGLGSGWLDANINDLWRHEDLFEPVLVNNRTVLNGHLVPIPRAYRSHIEYTIKSGDAPLIYRQKFDNISASLGRQLQLVDRGVNWNNDYAKLDQLKNRIETAKYKIAARHRL